MKIIVTGGSGMVGRHLQEIMPHLIYLSSSDCDLTNAAETDSLFAREKPDAVIHLAAKVGGILQNISHPAEFYDQNIKMNTHVVSSARNHGVTNFLAILSTCMYPDVAESYPMTEEDIHKGPPARANFSYAYTKRCMAVQIEAYNQQCGLNYNYLIPCNLYGEYDNFEDAQKSHFITALIKKIIDAERENKQEISLFGTGKPMRQFMHAGDLARVIKSVVDGDIRASFNVAPVGQNYSIDQMARMSLGALGKEGWSIRYDAEKPDGQFRKDVDCSRMADCLGDFAFTPFEDGVCKVYNKIKEKYGV